MDPYDLNLDASLIPTSTGADAEDFMKLAEPGFITYDMSSLTPETFDPSGIDDYLQSLGASLSASNPFALPGFQFIPGTTPSSNTGYTEYLFPIPSTSPGASSSTVSTSTSTLTSNTPSTTPMSRNDQHIGSLNINEPPSNGGLEARFWQPAQTPQRRDSVVVVGPQNQ
ncbi:hypothetical protein FRC03_001410 [Tulasnella sp. 419]|nr:hypothetical protein FRC03_001410 [Tulasnella sp. 419]